MKQDVVGLLGSYTAVSSKFGKFYILSGSQISILDAASGRVDRTIQVSAGAIGLVIDSPSLAYLYSENELRKVNLDNGAELQKVSVPVEAFSMNDQYLFAAGNARASIIDKASLTIIQTIKLEGIDESGNQATLLSPVLSISYQNINNLLVIAGSPKRPYATGHFAEIDLNNKTLKGIFASGTFSGSRYALNKTNRLVILEHTNTPVDSTHAMLFDIRADGAYAEVGTHGTMFDMFEEDNRMEFSDDESLAIMANGCFQFCGPINKGIIVYDLKEDKRLPNITEDFLGFLPNEAYFVRK